MQVTGLKKRSIADQKGIVDFNFALTFNSMSGRSECGLSGTSVFKFTFDNGRIYDPVGKFVSSYQKDIPVVISGQLGQESYDYAIDNNLKALGNPTGSGTYSWIYANSPSMDFNASVKGEVPSYSLPSSGEYFFQNYNITGNIVNLDPSRKFRIFDASVSLPGSPYSVVDFTTGDISNTGNIVISSNLIGLGDYNLPISLATNFGNINFQMAISGDHTATPDVYVGLSPNTSNVRNSIAKAYAAQISNFPANAEVGILLEFVSGVTGNVYYFKQQSSNLIVEAVTGQITGQNVLTKRVVYPISGLDPKTNIWETGLATGDLSSNLISASGPVSYGYNQQVYGVGYGSFTTDYLISGTGLLSYNGLVPLTGGYLLGTTTNLFGYGSTPTVDSGIAPTATGRVLVYPTGEFQLISGLPSGSFYQGLISVPKAFVGDLSMNYSIVGIGWATGAKETGIVDSKFVLNFEPGYYTFTKNFSGIVSGDHVTMATFRPELCVQQTETTKGVINGTYSWPDNPTTSVYGYSGGFLDCLQITGLPQITFTGYPASILNEGGDLVAPHRVYMVTPPGGFSTGETSENALAGAYTRTKTSRMGVTPSGTGRFSQIVDECLHSGNWEESLVAQDSSYLCDSSANYQGFFQTQSRIPGLSQLSLNGTFRPSYTLFEITGDGTREIFLRAKSDNQYQDTSVSLYKQISGATPSTGSLTQTSFYAGASIKIGSGTYTFQTGSGFAAPAYFHSLFELRDILNSGSQVSAYFSGDYNTLRLRSVGSGLSYNGIVLSGSRGLVFHDNFMTGAIDGAVVRGSLLGENDSWQNSDLESLNRAYAYGLVPSRPTDPILYRSLPSGKYFAVVESRPITAAQIGTISFTKDSYTGCENYGYVPIKVSRSVASLYTVTGEVQFSQYGNDYAQTGIDFSAKTISFSFYPGQTELTVYPPVFDDGNLELTERFFASLVGYYEGGNVSAVSGINSALVSILDDDNPIPAFTGVCQSVYFPGGTGTGPSGTGIGGIGGVGSVQPDGNTHPYPGGGMAGGGDVHLVLMNEFTTALTNAPFNVDDNSSFNKLVWFYAKKGESEVTISYTQKEFPTVAGGKCIDEITINNAGSITTITADSWASNFANYQIGDILNFSVYLKEGMYCDDGENQDLKFLEFSTSPRAGWYDVEKIGGAFYYLLKAATGFPAQVNTYGAAGYDGLTDFLALVGKGRGVFEGNDLDLISETPQKSVINDIFKKWNQLCFLTGFWDGSYDPVLSKCIGNVEITYTWGSSKDLDTSTTFLGASVGFSCGDGNEYMTWDSGDNTDQGPEHVTIKAGQALIDGAWSGSVNIDLKAGWFTPAEGSGPASVTVTFAGESRTKQIAPGTQSDCASTSVGTITIDEDGNLTLV